MIGETSNSSTAESCTQWQGHVCIKGEILMLVKNVWIVNGLTEEKTTLEKVTQSVVVWYVLSGKDLVFWWIYYFIPLTNKTFSM